MARRKGADRTRYDGDQWTGLARCQAPPDQRRPPPQGRADPGRADRGVTIMAGQLDSWNDGGTRQAIEAFIARVTRVGSPDFVPEDERVAVFDNDGTLWCEKPLPIQADFLMRRLGQMAEQDPSLRSRQPWKAVVERDYQW